MKCPTCGTGSLVEAVRSVPYHYKGRKTVTRAVRGRFCDNRNCREVVLDRSESTRVSRVMIEFNKKVNSELTPIGLLTEVRGMLKLTQQQAAKVFGGGPNAFSRYESGKTTPPVALVQLFKVLKRHPTLFDEIAKDEVYTDTRKSRVVLKPEDRRPFALWDGGPKRSSTDHDSVHDDP